MIKFNSLHTLGLLALLCSIQPGLAFRSVSVGSSAPSMVVKDLEGTDVALAFEQQLSVVIFWRTDQAFSLQALRDLERIHAKFSAQNVRVLAITEGGTPTASVKTIVDELGLSYPVYHDAERKAEELYGVIVFPSSGIIGSDGQLKFYLPSRNSNYREIIQGKLSVELGLTTEEEFLFRMRQIGEDLADERLQADEHRKKGLLLSRTGKPAQAIEELRQALDLDPELKDAHLGLGYAYLDVGQTELARNEFQWVLEKHPRSPGARVGLGISEVRSGRLDRGIEMLSEAVTLNPDPVRGYYELAIAYEKKGDLEQALHAYHWAVKKLLQGRQ